MREGSKAPEPGTLDAAETPAAARWSARTARRRRAIAVRDEGENAEES
jgi:hypothetical protein